MRFQYSHLMYTACVKLINKLLFTSTLLLLTQHTAKLGSAMSLTHKAPAMPTNQKRALAKCK